jgi:hypothetical protein
MPAAGSAIDRLSSGAPMAASNSLQGACVWKGSEIERSDRWIKQLPANVSAEIDLARIDRPAVESD